MGKRIVRTGLLKSQLREHLRSCSLANIFSLTQTHKNSPKKGKRSAWISTGIMAKSQHYAGCKFRTGENQDITLDGIHFFFPLEGLANRAGSICSFARPLTEKSRAARSWRVPPHFSPSAVRAPLSFSRPSNSISAAEVKASKSRDSWSTDWEGEKRKKN